MASSMHRPLSPIIALTLLSCATSMVQKNPIDHITIYSLWWEDMYAVSMSPWRVIRSGQVDVSEIADTEFLQRVEEHADRIEGKPSHDESPIDGRLLCLLHRADGHTDTLAFSRLRMEYNGRTYDTDTELLRMVATTQSDDYQETVEHWITVLKKEET